MLFEEKKSLSNARLDHAMEALSAAQNMIHQEQYLSASNRLYYAVFHAMRAVLAFDGIYKKHHSGIISEFRRLYIKTDTFPKELSTTISRAYDMRTGSDYDDFFIVSKQEVKELLQDVEVFLSQIQQYLQHK